MKAVIKILTAKPDFSADEKQLMKRIVNLLIEHDMSVWLTIKQGKILGCKQFKLKAV